MKVWRQGDVLITPTNKIDTDIVEKKDKILAHGEVTGHAHRISKGDAMLAVAKSLADAMDSAREMQIKAFTPSEVSHEEHAGIVLPIGDYRVTIQREFDWATKLARRVED